MHVQGFFGNFVGSNLFSGSQISFSFLQLYFGKKKSSKILGCFQPLVVVPNHRNWICSVCLPECNKKQIFLIVFQDRTCLITQSFSFYLLIYSVWNCRRALFGKDLKRSDPTFSLCFIQTYGSLLFLHSFCFGGGGTENI